MIESELEKISVVNQCEMIGLCRVNHYYVPVIDENIVAIKAHIKNFNPSGSVMLALEWLNYLGA